MARASRTGVRVAKERSPSISPSDTTTSVTAAGLPDGSVVDVIKVATGELRLVRFDGSHLFGPLAELDVDGRKYRVSTFEPSWLTACRFPHRVGDSLNSSELWAQLREFSSCLELDEQHKSLVFAFVFASWFADVLPLIPTLWGAGPEPTDRLNLLRFLHSLCRRPVLIADCRPSTAVALPSELQPTILAPIQKASQKIIPWLETGLYRGFHVPQAGSLKTLPYAKALVCCGLPPTSIPLLEIALPPNSVSFPAQLPDGLAKSAMDLQANFLRYRLENYRRVACAPFNPPAFSSPGMRHLASCLTSCFDTEETRADIIMALSPADERQRLERSADLHAIVLEALLIVCHEQPPLPSVLVGELTALANTILTGRGEVGCLKPRQVGSLLDALGFERAKLGSHGRGPRLSRSIRCRAHQLAVYYAVCSQPREDCSDCRAYRSGRAPSVDSCPDPSGNGPEPGDHGGRRERHERHEPKIKSGFLDTKSTKKE